MCFGPACHPAAGVPSATIAGADYFFFAMLRRFVFLYPEMSGLRRASTRSTPFLVVTVDAVARRVVLVIISSGSGELETGARSAVVVCGVCPATIPVVEQASVIVTMWVIVVGICSIAIGSLA